MSIIRSRAGIAYGTKSKAIIADLGTQQFLYGNKDIAPTQPSESLSKGDVALWGDDNLLPYEMMKNVENTGVLSAAIETKARIAIGKGPQLCKVVNFDKDGQEELEFVNDQEIKDWMDRSNFFEDSYALAKDCLATGNPFDNLVLTKDRSQIAGFKRMDPCECRFSKMDPKSRRSEFVYLSSDWNEFSSLESAASDPHMGKIPLLDKTFPLMDLQQRTKDFSFMLSLQYPLFGRKYYALPLWWPAREWIKMAQGIPELKKAMVKNQMNINYIVEIHPQFWENYDPRFRDADPKVKCEIQEEFYDSVEESLVGGENSYKSLFTTSIPGINGKESQPGIKITTIDDKLKEGKLLVDSAAANSEILFAMLMNPALLGAGQPGGPDMGAGSGSNIREAYLCQVMLMELERRLISKRFLLAKGYNGWDPTYTLRFPNQILTTLNTGANTQSAA